MKLLLYEMKFRVPNYSRLQNPGLWGLLPPDSRSLCPLSSTEFVEPPPRKKFLGTPLDKVTKGKLVPLQVCSGPKDSRKLRFPDFMTTAEDGGKVVSLTPRSTLPPGSTPGTHFC
jgi:hypothetical protein